MLEIRGNYARCLVIVVISMGLGGAKRWSGGLKSSYEGKRASIMGRDKPSRNHILKK